jgi:uracil-DNA glycosylase
VTLFEAAIFRRMTRLDRDLEAHRAELQRCRRCEHPGDVRPIVSIARSPRIVLVGQAPGKTEAAGGHPFAGRAGRTLFSWFARLGLDESTVRERIYISAVTRCYPGPSPTGRGDRVPSPAERTECSGWLTRELEIIRPRLVIPVGRLAIDAILGAQPLEDVIGREHSIRVASRDAVAVPLPHPSGASSWIYSGNHRVLLERAMDLIGVHWKRVEGRRAA